MPYTNQAFSDMRTDEACASSHQARTRPYGFLWSLVFHKLFFSSLFLRTDNVFYHLGWRSQWLVAHIWLLPAFDKTNWIELEIPFHGHLIHFQPIFQTFTGPEATDQLITAIAKAKTE